MSKKVLILYSSVGLGHKSIAENIGYYLERAGMEVKLADIKTVQQGNFEKSLVAAHQFINRYLPFIWGWLYAWGYYPILPLRVWLAGFNCGKTLDLVGSYNPDLIITTQTTASAVVSYLKRRGLYNNTFGIAFSDYHLHRFWLYKEADFYLANIEEQKIIMVGLGVPANRIFVCGIILKPKPEIDKEEVRKKYELDVRQKVALISSGSLGSGVDGKLVDELIAYPEIKVIAVCGKNKNAFEALSMKYRDNPRVEILGFHSPMDEFYAIADIYITKPGGLSVAEALSWQLPVLISHMLPGQEKYNYAYLLRHNLVMPVSGKLTDSILSELRQGSFGSQLRDNPAISIVVKNHQTWVRPIEVILSL